MEYEPVIGLEVHVQLKTKSKVFCGCPTTFGAEPNTQVCPVCLGMPGSLPVLNRTAFEYSMKVGLALNCTVQEFTKFDRKHYYYPDLPKNFQISQYDLPISKDGFLDIEIEGKTVRIGIRRAHLEEDAGKLMHKEDKSLVDYNRTGQPLLEIVTEPDIHTPEEAYQYLTDLKQIIQYLGVSDCDMEKGTLRCDANVSVRPKGASELGVKSELKNLNSFKAVRDGLAYEIGRHIETLQAGDKVVQETRLWDEKTGKTVPMRSKEEAKDYRYFPEPDLPPFIVKKEEIEKMRQQLPELPKQLRQRLVREYGISDYAAGVVTATAANAAFTEMMLKEYPGKEKQQVINWITGPLLSEANARGKELCALSISPGDLSGLLRLVSDNTISNLTAKSVLTEMLDSGKSAGQIVKEKNLAQVSDTAALEEHIAAAISENPKSVQDFKAGRENAVMFLVGQVMKKSKGKANPKVVQELLKRRLQNA
ncbi:MAG: Asp-tRNA(Asn)/Glu-tRNA(Gln) amidotransferase subunit GatB [Deltaproteobacteria bacterium]